MSTYLYMHAHMHAHSHTPPEATNVALWHSQSLASKKLWVQSPKRGLRGKQEERKWEREEGMGGMEGKERENNWTREGREERRKKRKR